MTEQTLALLLRIGGFAQLSVLIASVQVPRMLDWPHVLATLPRLVRQLYWIYAWYVVLAIVALGSISILCAAELATGSLLARAFCSYAALFWGIRLALQRVLDVGPHLTTPGRRAGYHALTVVFTLATVLFVWAAVHPPRG